MSIRNSPGGWHANIDSAGRRGHDPNRYSPHHGYGLGNGSSFYFEQPNVNAEAKIFKFMKVFAGASHRMVWGGETHNNNPSGFDSPTLGQLQGFGSMRE